LAETIADVDWLRQLRDERLAWLDSQNTTSINPATGKWLVWILDATDYPRPKAENVKLGYVHSASGMRLGHGLSLLSERVGEGSWTLPLEIGWIPPESNPIAYGVAQVEEFVKRRTWRPKRVLVVDAHYTGEPFLNPVHPSRCSRARCRSTSAIGTLRTFTALARLCCCFVDLS